MSETNTFSPDQIFQNYELHPDMQPGELYLNESGILQDDNHMFFFRRSSIDTPLSDAEPTDLYNGKSAAKTFNATEGHGLYVANTPDATRVPGIKGDDMYCIRVPLEGTKVADTISGDDLTANQQKAARLHKARSVVIGVPNPGTAKWDTWYEDADVVTFRPMAMARVFLGNTVSLDVGSVDKAQVKPTWAIIRDPSKAEIIAKKQ